jgi:hypothetical protein
VARPTVLPSTRGEGKITVWNLPDNQIVAEVEISGPGLFIRARREFQHIEARRDAGSVDEGGGPVASNVRL